MTTLGKALLLAALGAGLAAPARAADLVEAPPLVPVEVGSGWYLRGDVSYDFKSHLDVDYDRHHQTGYDPNDATVAVYGDERGDYGDVRIDDAINGGLGFGYQFTDWFRGDLTAHYWKADLKGRDAGFDGFDCAGNIAATGTACRSDGDGNVETWELMANAYVDLGTFAGFTPYVGGGVGAANVDYDNINLASQCYQGTAVCSDPATDKLEGENSWRFAYALMAGASYDLTSVLKLDVGYRYVDVDGGDMFSHDKAGLANNGDDDGFHRHTIQAGLRYSLF